MAKKPIKFGGKKRYAAGGSTSRAQSQFDRRMADIESDYQRQIERGKDPSVARAKRRQREADARDDLAKRTGGDRTATRAAERETERSLSAARRSASGRSPARREALSAAARTPSRAPSLESITPAAAATSSDVAAATSTSRAPSAQTNRDSMRFGAAFRDAREAGNRTFTWRGREYTTEVAGSGPPSTGRRTTARPSGGTSGTPRGAGATGTAPRRAGTTNRTTPREEARALRAEAQNLADRMSASNRAQNLSRSRVNPNRPDQMRRTDFTPEDVLSPEQRARVYRGMFQRQDNRASFSNAKGGSIKKMAKGGSIDGIAKRGKTRAKRKK